MFNIIIFLIGAGIMFYMAWRSWSRRRKLMTRGEKVEATVQAPSGAGTAKPTCWSSPLLAAPTASITPSLPRAESLHRELSSPFIMTPTTPPRCMSRATSPFWGAEVLYVVLGIVLLVLMVGIVR